MFNKKLFIFSAVAVLLVALFVAAGSAMANPPLMPFCGASPQTPFGPLTVKKDVFCQGSRIWEWTILKTADQSSLTLSPGQVFQSMNYTVTASAMATGSYDIAGNITVMNTTNSNTNPGYPIIVTGVSDTLGPVTCPVSFPVELMPGQQFICTYTGSLTSAEPENTATAVDSNGVKYSRTASIDWNAGLTETNQCAEVSDSFQGVLGNVCAGDETIFIFTYSRTIGPYDVCGKYTVENIASLLVEGKPGGSSSWTVDVTVPCEEGCSLTPGYWKTHSTFGPAPYDDTWAQIGENTTFFSSGKTYYQALWTAPQGNAYWILAHAYIAAKLNQLNGADFTVAQAAFDQATALFSYPTNTPAFVGALRGSARNTWINLAAILDNYNNGLIGPGHCSE